MPRRDTKYRALTAEFREFLTQNGIWPSGHNYMVFMRKNHSGIATKALTDLRAGAFVPEKAVIGLINQIRIDDGMDHARVALNEYVEAKGVTDTTKVTIGELLEKVCEPSLRTPASPESTDYLEQGVRAMWNLFSLPGRPLADRSRLCENSEVQAAVEWLYVFVAYSLAKKQERDAITLENSRGIAEAHMGIDLDEYARRAREWNTCVPGSVRLALGRRGPIGMTITLPLREDVYRDVRDGKRASYECNASDLCKSSRYLIIEACAERAAGVRKEASNPTLPLLTSLLIQLGYFSGLNSDDQTPLHLLSFAGTDQARKRLAKQRFEPTGAVMPRSGVVMMERTVSLKSGMDIDAVTVALLSWFSRYMPGM